MSAAEIDPRVEKLLEFYRAADANMRDLPLYQPGLDIQAVGFREWEGYWAGVILTPWFMNLALLPKDPGEIAGQPVGTKVSRNLPCGDKFFFVYDEEGIGPFLMHSIHSPMKKFHFPAAAETAAWAALGFMMEPPPAPEGEAEGDGKGLDRRDVLRGTFCADKGAQRKGGGKAA